jgi:nickel transport protein
MMEFRGKLLLIVSILFFICVMLPSYAHAHRMLVDSLVENGTVLVDVFFPDGKPAKNVKVEVYRADGTLYLSDQTDAEGRFSFDPKDETYVKVVAIGQMGHRAEQEVSIDSIDKTESGASGKSEGTAPVEGRVRRREPLPLREVFAGFGYIIGVAGILMYIKARSDLKKAKDNVSSGDR